jgi:hypothetical protein
MHVSPGVMDAELLQSKLNLDFIKYTNSLFCVTPVLKLPHNKIAVSVSGFMLENINRFRGIPEFMSFGKQWNLL